MSAQRAAPGDDGWQQFAQLVRVINGGDLAGAKKVYDKFTQSAAGEMLGSNPQGRLAQAMTKVGDALNAGDIGQAQQALTQIRPRSEVPTVAAPSIAPPLDPNAPGAKLNVIV